MSLTATLKIPDVHAFFMERITMPTSPPLVTKVPRRTSNPQLMGTALDYAIRFALRKKYGAVHKNKLIAELALLKPIEMSRIARGNIENILRQALDGVNNAQGGTSDFAYWCFQLANLDYIYRQGELPAQIPVVTNKNDIAELRILLRTALSVWPVPESYCLLNPTFGKGSVLVGGADADLIQDGCIWDFKCVKTPELREPLLQLVGYHVLSVIGGVDGLENHIIPHEVAVYFARHGTIIKVPVDELVTKVAVREMADFLMDMGARRQYDGLNDPAKEFGSEGDDILEQDLRDYFGNGQDFL